jgi:ribosomal protein S18 acetylase RimI-like enzyme
MVIKYRNASEKDIEAMMKMSRLLIDELHQKFDKKRFESMITRIMSDPEQNKGAFIADDENTKINVGMIIGVVKPSRWGKKIGYLRNIVVLPEARGQGVGKELAQRAVEYLKSMHASPISVNIHDSQPQAITMYERLGFTRAGNKMLLRT